jgi:hypothetical protein
VFALRQTALIILIACVVLAPNIIRNYAVFERFVPISTNGGINFLIGNNPQSTGKYYVPEEIHLEGNEAEQSIQAYAIGFT